jgi:hypothetical protein
MGQLRFLLGSTWWVDEDKVATCSN